MEYLETIYSALIILRIYCVGLAFIAYCRYQGKEVVNTLVGAIIYTFCGFILYAGIRHPYFTNAVILLPLNFIGIEKLLRENKKTFLIFIVFITAISNYYFFYMITIINVIYAVVKYIIEYNNGRKEFFKKVFTAIGCYILGVLMASIVLLPTIYAFLSSARGGNEQILQYSPNFYENFFMGFICTRFSNWTVIAVSSIILLMIPILFTKLKEKECKTYVILFLITTVMLLLPFVSSFMNGLSFPNNRWGFAYAFILAYIVTICFKKDLKYSRKQRNIMTLLLAIYCLLGIWITDLEIEQYLDFYISMGIAIFIWLFITLNNAEYKKIKWITKISKYSYIIVIFLVICNIWTISFSRYSESGKGYASQFLDNNSVMKRNDTLSGTTDSFKEAIEYIKENDDSFYRIAKNDVLHQNTSLLYNYHPIQTYLSIGNGYVYKLSKGLEDNNYSATKCINEMDRRTKIMTLLGTKYYICANKDMASVPYGYELYHEISNTQIYINKHYISLGTMYNNYILEEQYDKLTPLEKEDVLLNTAVLSEDTDKIKKNENIDNEINKGTSIKYIEKENLINNNQIKTTKKYQVITLEMDGLNKNTELYLNIKNLNYRAKKNKKKDFEIITSFNGITNREKVLDRLSTAYYMKNPDFLINLGVVKQNGKSQLQIIFNKKGTYTFDKLEVLAVPMDKYENEVEKLKQNEMKNVTYGDNFVSGHVNNNTDSILQITTSYSSGWKAFVDGKETEVIKVNEGFIGTVVEAGEHEIRFEYQTPYLRLGSILSAVGVIGFVVLAILERKRIVDNKNN